MGWGNDVLTTEKANALLRILKRVSVKALQTVGYSYQYKLMTSKI